VLYQHLRLQAAVALLQRCCSPALVQQLPRQHHLS
jgi:hypothetical protein